MYLPLAIFWLVGGVALIIYDAYSGDSGWMNNVLGLSPGWVMLLLSGYNFMRWWSRRMARAGDHVQFKRSNYLRDPPPIRREPPDPNFIFTDEPGPPPAEGENAPPRD